MDGSIGIGDRLATATAAATSQVAGRLGLAAPISCVGRGLHSGARTTLTLAPAAPGAGVRFHRRDLGITIPARFDHVVDTRLCTALARADAPEARVGTVEHVLAALAGAGIDDALVELDGPEVPILDGSAEPFLFLIDCAGTIRHPGEADVIEVLRPVRVTDGEAWAELRPGLPGVAGLDLELSIDFAAAAIGRQAHALRLGAVAFRHELAAARTFALAAEIARLRSAGLARGGSLDNAVVVDGDTVLNPGGLRFADEFVRHKLLDAVGDLALAGGRLHGRFRGHRSGHALNNRLLRALFADRMAFRRQPAAQLPVAAAA